MGKLIETVWPRERPGKVKETVFPWLAGANRESCPFSPIAEASRRKPSSSWMTNTNAREVSSLKVLDRLEREQFSPCNCQGESKNCPCSQKNQSRWIKLSFFPEQPKRTGKGGLITLAKWITENHFFPEWPEWVKEGYFSRTAISSQEKRRRRGSIVDRRST